MRSRWILVLAAISISSAAMVQAPRHLNQVVDLLAQKKAVFGLYAPANPRGRRGGGPPPADAPPAKSPAELAKDAMAGSTADYLFDGLTSRAIPLLILSAVCGIGSLVLLVRDTDRGARILAMGAVASVVVGWGVAQWPYILPESLEVKAAAAPYDTLLTLVVATIGFALLVVPGFVLLYVLDQRSMLPEEGVEEPAARVPPTAPATPVGDGRSSR